jgi:replicative DNA helicase
LLGPRNWGSVPITVWPELHNALRGFAPGQIILLMAATSRGKTSMALQAATCAATHNQTPVIWTMEMSPSSIFKRMVGQLSGVKTSYRELSAEQRSSQRDALGILNDKPVYFDRHSRSVSSFVASVRHVRKQYGCGFGVVDYLQLIRGSSRYGSRAQEVSENSRALKLAAMELEIPILVLSQVDRASVKGQGTIGLYSAKESGDIENDADVVLWIDAGELSRDQDTVVSLHVGKQREGPAGFGIPMVFRPGSQTFMELKRDDR